MAIYPDKKNGKPNGRWVVEVQLRGQRLRARCDTFDEAKTKESEFKTQLDSGIVPIQAKRKFSSEGSRPETFSEAIKRAEGRLWVGKASEVENLGKLERILAFTGDRKLNAIDTVFVDDVIETLQATVSDKTVNRYLSAFRTFLSWCKDRGYMISELPKFAWRDEDEGRIRWITAEEETELKALHETELWNLIRIDIRSGLRRGELLSVEPEQITSGWVHLWETKSGTPRSVPLCPEDEEDLRWLAAGRMPTKSALRYAWDKARADMGLANDPWFVFHACRHTCATRMVNANVNLRVIQQFMGHKRIETTLRYAHVNVPLLTDALRAVLGSPQVALAA